MFNNIPKIINFYWGGYELSYLNYMTLVSFKKLNPSWEINFYEPDYVYDGENTWNSEEHLLKFTGINYYNNLKKLNYINFKKIDFEKIGFFNNVPETFKADYFRWFILNENGGVWSDLDILYIKPIETLKINNDVDTVICLGEFGHIIGFYMSKKNNYFFENVLTLTKESFNLNEYQSIGSVLLNKIYPDINQINNTHQNIKLHNINMSIIYPYNHINIDKLFNTIDMSKLNDDKIGIHWYNGSNISKKFNNDYNPNNINNINNTITELINNI